MTTKTQLENAKDSIRSIESAQYGYGKYKTRIESCFSKVTDDDCTKLLEYGLFQLSTQEESVQDALLTAFRSGFLSPKQMKATGKPVVSVPASVPSTARDFLARRLEFALRTFGEHHVDTLTGGLGPHALEWDWRELMLSDDFEPEYAAIAAYESRFSAFVTSLPYKPTGWKPVSDSHVELAIDLATFATIQPQPQSARFENGEMRWVVPVPVQEPTPVQEPVAVQEPEAVKPKAVPVKKATTKAKPQ